ncbi:hypothetical protein D3C80_1896450 [compost metagenome]
MRKDQNDPVRRLQPGDQPGRQAGIVVAGEIAATLRPAQSRIEVLAIEVDEIDGMAACDKRLLRLAGDTGGKAVFQRVGKYEQNTHPWFLLHKTWN